jgi:hypothetical protein
MPWYARSAEDRDTHWGTVARGQVSTACAISFRTAWAGAVGDPEADSVCPACALQVRRADAVDR